MLKKAMVLIVVALIIVVVLTCTLLLKTSNQSVGYVLFSNDTNMFVIEFNDWEIEGKSQKEINDMVENAANEHRGLDYNIPKVNQLLKTEFEPGDKVKIYWHGYVIQTLPSKIEGTVFITNLSK